MPKKIPGPPPPPPPPLRGKGKKAAAAKTTVSKTAAGKVTKAAKAKAPAKSPAKSPAKAGGTQVSIEACKSKGCFEVKAKDKTVISLLDMPRPFTKLKALDMDEIAAEVIKACK
ncbi:hypothetical protein RI054_05g26280 [Pseudoscourfieldia marina]